MKQKVKDEIDCMRTISEIYHNEYLDDLKAAGLDVKEVTQSG